MNNRPTKPEPKSKTENNVHSKDFESKMDEMFTSKTKEKDTWTTRKCSIKLFGQWT